MRIIRALILLIVLSAIFIMSLFFPASGSLHKQPPVIAARDRVLSDFDGASERDIVLYVGYEISRSLGPMAYMPWFLGGILATIVIALIFYIIDHSVGPKRNKVVRNTGSGTTSQRA